MSTPNNPKHSVTLNELQIIETISKGSFGTVYKVRRKSDNRVYALKQVSLKGIKRAEREEAIDEARVLSRLTHPHVIRHYHSFLDHENRLNILMEFASGGTIHSYLKSLGKNQPLSEEFTWRFLIQSLLGLKHVHDRKIIHRDIKTLNLFLDSNQNVKIGDFGIARVLGMNTDLCRTIVGTPFYLSPELCEDKPYNEKTDVWALGVVMYECVMRRHPFEAQNEGALVRKILKGHYAPVSNCSHALQQIITECLEYNPVKRPTTTILLEKSIIKKKASQFKIDLECKNMAHSVDESQGNEKGDKLSQQVEQLQQIYNVVDKKESLQQQKQQAEIAIQANVDAENEHPFALKIQKQNYQHIHPQENQVAQQRAKKDNIGRLEDGHYTGEEQHLFSNHYRRLRPEKLPPAGVSVQYDAHNRPTSAPGFKAAPYGVQDALRKVGHMHRRDVQEHEEQMWTAKYEMPTFARKRCPELMATGPVMRMPIARANPNPVGVLYAASESSSSKYMGTNQYVGSTYQRSVAPY